MGEFRIILILVKVATYEKNFLSFSQLNCNNSIMKPFQMAALGKLYEDACCKAQASSRLCGNR